MQKKTLPSLLFITLAIISCTPAGAQKEQKPDVEKSMEIAQAHLENSLKALSDITLYPRSTNTDGSINLVPARDWTSGFYPGSLWFMYDYTGEKVWADSAASRTAGLESVQFNTHTHDLGFVLYSSFGNGLRLTENETYAPILLQGATTLIKRFDPEIGSIRSWDFKPWEFPVIIDNLMNMELLFWATKYSGDSTFYDIAVKHADTTLKNHFRADNSSFHVVDYDTITHEVSAKKTHQGKSDDSAWARGQAWGLYGYTLMYRETKDKKYLAQAEKIAEFILNHPNLPEDMVPYWDFDAPNEVRDASAAAVVASGLLELSTYSDQSTRYFDAAEKILASLSSPAYLAEPGTNNNFILMHSTGHMPKGTEIDGPIAYADYYYLEALLRYQKHTAKK
jgi:unsaturated chondroitin disaccharide hydrolase